MRLYGTRGMRTKAPQRKGPNLEEIFHIQVRALKLPAAQREYRFHPKRQWKFDFAWPHAMIAVEIEGGTYSGGRHVRPEGYKRDCIKYNHSALLGWRVFRFTSDMVKSGEALDFIRGVL
jgi:hypothetical protein